MSIFLFLGMEASLVRVGFFLEPTCFIIEDLGVETFIVDIFLGLLMESRPTRISGLLVFM